MELTNYLKVASANHCGSDELSESSLSCLDQRNSSTHPRQLTAFGDHCYAKIKMSPSDWIEAETDPDNEIPQVDVEGHEVVNSLVESTLVAIDTNNSFRIKLSLNRESIKFLRRSLKLVEDRLESTQSTIKRKWKSKVYSYLESIKRYDKTDHQSSTDESESENESQMYKKVKRYSNLENDQNEIKPIDEIIRTFKKCIQFRVNHCEDFWMYSRNLIENGRIQEQNFPVNICFSSKDHLDKRLQFLTKLNPDPCVFSHVKHKEPWGESDFEQLLVPKIPKETAKRVLKGMSQGKLYNIHYAQLSQLFSGLIREEINGKTKCPLCGRVYTIRSSVIDHLESVHTNFACFCGRCGHLFLRSAPARIHKCPSKDLLSIRISC
ncbi:uncharacterized protein LOC128390813 [Panonychus citri]|uniref:uncharacterized protein LOC128390813 n=1 Tax=Panonychus citri TaxID=50023 RepID=UPI0023076959|nr:uncharacterized protein LOC128390813 [Panonychus citri]